MFFRVGVWVADLNQDWNDINSTNNATTMSFAYPAKDLRVI
jgi:hypothetical protein